MRVNDSQRNRDGGQRVGPVSRRARPAWRVMGVAVLLLLAAMTAGPGTARATPVTYDATADFSITNDNPNGTWSYGTEYTGGSTFTLLTNPFSNQYGLYWGEVWKNTSGSTVAGVAPGQISLRPLP